MSLTPQLAALSNEELWQRYQAMTPMQRIAAGLVRPATEDEIAAGQRGQGAPADFSGTVLPNPNGLKVSDDTESGIEPTQLPAGVSFQRQNYSGNPKMDVSNPEMNQMAVPFMQTVGTKSNTQDDPYASIAKPLAANPDDPYASIAKPLNANAEKPGFFKRLGQSLGLPTTMEELEQSGTPLVDPYSTAGRMIYNYGKTAVKGLQEGAHEAEEAGANVAEGQPILPNVGKFGHAVAHGFLQSIPIVGPPTETAGQDIEQGNYAGAAGGLTGVIGQVALPEVIKRAPAIARVATDAFSKDLPALTDAAHSNFMKAIPPTKSAPYFPDDLEAARPYLEDEHAASPIRTVADAKDAADSAIGRIEGKVHEYIRANPIDKIATSPLDSVKAALAPTNSLRNGFVDAGVKELAPYNLDQPLTVAKADALRRQFNAENAAFEAKNNYAQAQARVTDPGYAAREAASQALRDGIYDKLDERGIPGIRDLRQDEGSLIAIRNAAQNQIFNGEKAVGGTGANSVTGKVGKSLVQGSTVGGGAILGGYLGGYPGAAAGGIIGTGLGEAINRVAFPGNLTRDALIEKSFSKPITQGATLPEVPSHPTIRGLLNAPATELGPSTMTNPSSEPPAVEGTTRAVRKGLLLNEPSPELPAAGYTEPRGEPIGTPIGLKPQSTVQPKGWPNAASKTTKTNIPSTSAVPTEPANGRTGEGAAVYEPSQPSIPVASGARTNVQVPGTDQSYPATYEVRDLGDIHPNEPPQKTSGNPSGGTPQGAGVNAQYSVTNGNHEVTVHDPKGEVSAYVLAQEDTPGVLTVKSSKRFASGNLGDGTKAYGRLLEAAKSDAARSGETRTVRGDEDMTPLAIDAWKRLGQQGYNVQWSKGRPSVTFEGGE